MKLTRREATMLLLLFFLLFFGGGYYFFLLPQQNLYDEVKLEYQDLMEQKVQEELDASNMPALETQRIAEQAKADGNIEIFYQTLNSYTIDTILRQVIDQNQLQAQAMTIAPYIPVPNTELFPVQNGEAVDTAPSSLLRASASMSLSGSYADLLQALDALSATSFCLKVDSVGMNLSVDSLNDKALPTHTMGISVYGIDGPYLVIQKAMEEAKRAEEEAKKLAPADIANLEQS